MANNPLLNSSDVDLLVHIESRLQAIEKSIVVANTAMEKRLDGLNELRSLLNTMIATLITRDAVDSKVVSLQSQIDDLKTFKSELTGKASQSQTNIALFISFVSLLLALVALLLKLFGQ